MPLVQASNTASNDAPQSKASVEPRTRRPFVCIAKTKNAGAGTTMPRYATCDQKVFHSMSAVEISMPCAIDHTPAASMSNALAGAPGRALCRHNRPLTATANSPAAATGIAYGLTCQPTNGLFPPGANSNPRSIDRASGHGVQNALSSPRRAPERRKSTLRSRQLRRPERVRSATHTHAENLIGGVRNCEPVAAERRRRGETLPEQIDARD